MLNAKWKMTNCTICICVGVVVPKDKVYLSDLLASLLVSLFFFFFLSISISIDIIYYFFI